MGYSIRQQGDTVDTYVIEFLCDSRSDIPSLPNIAKSGSVALCIDDSSVWALNSKKIWVEIGASSSSGGGGSDTPSDSNSNTYRFKGSVDTYDDLPITGNQAGDVYNVSNTDMNYAWVEADAEAGTDAFWDSLGGFTTEELQTMTIRAIDALFDSTSENQ